MEAYLKRFNFRRPVSADSIAEFERSTRLSLPKDYTGFLKITNGGEGFIGETYVMLWSLEGLIARNMNYQVNRYMPGFLIIGSDGGGESFGYDIRTSFGSIHRVPFVGMSWSLAETVASSFLSFIENLNGGGAIIASGRSGASRPKAGEDTEIFEIKPIILGGSPADPKNKILLNRESHEKAVVFWNKIIKEASIGEKDSESCPGPS